MNQIYRLLLLACLWPSLLASAQSQTGTVVAVIAGQEKFSPSDVLLAEIETSLFKEKDIVLVERDQIRKILQEHVITAGGLTDAKNRIQLGQLLSADMLIFIDKVPDTKPPTCRVQATEACTGIILDSRICEEEAVIKNPSMFIEVIQGAMVKRAVPIKERLMIGVLGFRSEESGHLLDGLADALEALVPVELSRARRVMVLDREHVNHLRQEHELTRMEQELRASVLLLEVGLRRAGGEQRAVAVTLMLHKMTGGAPLTATLTIPTEDITVGVRSIVKGIMDLMRAELPTGIPTDPKVEAASFARQASLWRGWGVPERALMAAEAAYALDSNQSNRCALAKILHGQTSLYATVRSTQMLLDYYRIHRQVVKAGGEQAMEIPFFGYASQPSAAGDDAETAALRKELVQLEEDIFRFQLDYYREYYDRTWISDYNHSPYWQAWVQRLAAIGSYWPDSPDRSISIARQAIAAFTNPPPSAYKEMALERVRLMLGLPYSLPQYSVRSCPAAKDDARLLLREMTNHADPFVRMMGHVSLFRFHDNTVSNKMAVYEILLKDLPPEHYYRSYWFAEIEMFDCCDNRLRLAEPELSAEVKRKLNDYRTQLIQAAVASQSLWHLIAMGSTISRWLGDMVKCGEVKEADVLATKILDRLESPSGRASYHGALMIAKLKEKRKQYAKLLKTKEKSSGNFSGWDEYSFVKIDLGLKLTDKYSKPPVCKTICRNDLLCCVIEGSGVSNDEQYAQKTILTGHSLPSGRQVYKSDYTNPDKYHPIWPTCAAINKDSIIVGTCDGLLDFSLSSGQARRISQTNGLPGTFIHAIEAYEGRIYLGLDGRGGPGTQHAPASFVVYNPEKNTFRTIAAERAVVKRNDLDGVQFEIRTINGDAKRKCIWLTTTTVIQNTSDTGCIIKNELWKYDPITDKLENMPEIKPSNSHKYAFSAAMTNDYWVDWPVLIHMDDFSRITLPCNRKDNDGNWFSCAAFACDDGHFIQSLLSSSYSISQLFLCTTNKPYPIITTLPDGTEFSPVLFLHQTTFGVLAVGRDGTAFMIQRQRQEQR